MLLGPNILWYDNSDLVCKSNWVKFQTLFSFSWLEVKSNLNELVARHWLPQGARGLGGAGSVLGNSFNSKICSKQQRCHHHLQKRRQHNLHQHHKLSSITTVTITTNTTTTSTSMASSPEYRRMQQCCIASTFYFSSRYNDSFNLLQSQ